MRKLKTEYVWYALCLDHDRHVDTYEPVHTDVDFLGLSQSRFDDMVNGKFW